MKFYESGAMDQIMPSGHMAHALPRENFKAQPNPIVKAGAMPSQAGNLARQQMIAQQLRSMTSGQTHGLSPAGTPGQQVRGSGKIISNPRFLPR